MSRRRNLLEAFQSADRPASPPPPGGGAPPPPFRASPSLPAPRWLFPLLGVALAFVLGYLLGRSSAGVPSETRAQEPDGGAVVAPPRPLTQPRTFQERPPAENAAAPADARAKRIEDSALYDPRNLHTVVVVSYSKAHRDHLDFAWATHQALLDAGLPVFPPVASGNLVLVLAGAAPTADELKKTEAAVKNLLRDGKKAYADAYIARIDKLIPDRTPQGNRD